MKLLQSIFLFTTLFLVGCATTKFNNYAHLSDHKAIAVGSNGVIAYSSSEENKETAISQAIKRCSDKGGEVCKFIDFDGYSPMASKKYRNDPRAAPVDYITNVPFSVKYTCGQLTEEMANSLYRAGHKYLDGDSDGKPCESRSSLRSNTRKGSNCHYVKGYKRKNGTYVSGYTRCR